MNEQKNILTEKQMQELLPDYIFKRLNADESALFENSLPYFPEISKEIEEVSAVFSKLENMDIDKDIASRTRNMSIKVNERLYGKKNKLNSKFNLITRFALPILFIVALSIFMIQQGNFTFFNNQSKQIDEVYIELNEVTNEDIITLFPEMIYNPVSFGISENDYDELIRNELAQSIEPEILYLFDTDVYSYYHFLELLENMDEEDFQTLLSEIENVNI